MNNIERTGLVLPYIIAGTSMPPEARDPGHGLTGIFSGWDILEYVPELLSELGAHCDNEIGISDQLYSELSSDPNIVRLAFMNNDPEACIGYVRDVARSGRHENDTNQMHVGRQLAQLICHDYVSRRRNTWVGRWHYGSFLEE
jgi:hypothetical protein